MGPKGTTLDKAYGTKVRCYWEHVGEYIEILRNQMKTWLENIENNKIPKNL